MKQSVFLQSTRLFTRVLIFILCLAMFAGCLLAPESDSGDILTDEDANAPDAAVDTSGNHTAGARHCDRPAAD
ncbi:MAG: hypothetical protein R2912_11090 [Eubacteriales bacterium]